VDREIKNYANTVIDNDIGGILCACAAV